MYLIIYLFIHLYNYYNLLLFNILKIYLINY